MSTAIYDLSEEYADQQKKAGEQWNERKEALAKAHTEKLEQTKSPAAESFKEQGALYNNLNDAQKNDPANQLTRQEADEKLIKQEEIWKFLSARKEETEKTAKLLQTKSTALGAESLVQFGNQSAELLKDQADRTRPAADAAKERILKSVSADTERNFSNGSATVSNPSYKDLARSALNRDEQFQNRMERLQTAIEREQDPLKKDLMGAKRDFEFNEYKSAQTQKISHLTNDPKMTERSNQHDKEMDSAALRIKSIEIKMQERDKQPINQEMAKDINLVKAQQLADKDVTRKFDLEGEQTSVHKQMESNALENGMINKALQNPKFIEAQKRVEAANAQQQAAMKTIYEHQPERQVDKQNKI